MQSISRVQLEDGELHGERMRAGAPVVLLTGAAKRDPAQFAEPGRLDVGQADNRCLAFGGGIHYCLGAPLARQIAFATLLGRFPVLRLASDQATYQTLGQLPRAHGAAGGVWRVTRCWPHWRDRTSLQHGMLSPDGG